MTEVAGLVFVFVHFDHGIGPVAQAMIMTHGVTSPKKNGCYHMKRASSNRCDEFLSKI